MVCFPKNLTMVVPISFPGKVVRHASGKFSRVAEHWDREKILDIMQKINHEVDGVNPKLVMRILRHAMTGMKV